MLLAPASEVPVALYGVDDEEEREFCSDWRNCCRMSMTELVLPVPPVEDELSVGGGPPWPR